MQSSYELNDLRLKFLTKEKKGFFFVLSIDVEKYTLQKLFNLKI